MSLYIDYRPKNFDEIIGNAAVVKSLKAILEREKKKIPHAFLLHGSTGTGKTTIARIISTVLECAEYDYMEINTGNNRGIETARTILQNIYYMPMGGKVRVVLLDECHATTKDFQNALLKALEDTPSHVYFILCTTDPQKLLPTIRNRCMTFEMKKLNECMLAQLLESVILKEGGFDVSDKIVDQIAEKADGCPRQALVLLDQIIDLDPRERRRAIHAFQTQEQKIIDLCRALLKKDKWISIATILKGIEEEPESVRRAVLGYMNTVILNAFVPQAAIVFDVFENNFYDTGKSGLTFACLKSVI